MDPPPRLLAREEQDMMRSSVSTTALEMLKTARSGWVRRSDFMETTGAGYGSITRLTRHLVAMGFLERRELLSIKNVDLFEYRLSDAWRGKET